MRVLDMGIGPGTISKIILEQAKVELFGLDYSVKMLKTVITDPSLGSSVKTVRGVFENMPFQVNIFDMIFASFSLQDSLHWRLTIKQLYSLCKKGGVILIINIGKPDNRIIRFFITVYMRYVMPLLASKSFGEAPWRLLISVFDNLPVNKELNREIIRNFGNVEMHEFLLGGIIVLTAKKL